MRIGLIVLLSCLAVSLTGGSGSRAWAAAKQNCTTDPYGTRTCTDTPEVKAPKKQKTKKVPTK